jgi:uncharacterized protein
MYIRFLPHNTHLEDPSRFSNRDPQLRQLARQLYIHESVLLGRLPGKIPDIYTLGGGRQIDKTALLKQWMLKLIEDGILPEQNCLFLRGN